MVWLTPPLSNLVWLTDRRFRVSSTDVVLELLSSRARTAPTARERFCFSWSRAVLSDRRAGGRALAKIDLTDMCPLVRSHGVRYLRDVSWAG